MKIAVIGAGAMGGALVEGILKIQGQRAEDITVADPVAETRERFGQMGVVTTGDNAEAVKGTELVAVVVKPWLAEKVLLEIKGALDYDRQQLVVIAAGVKAEQVKQWMEKKEESKSLPNFYLVIPNIAITLKQSMTFIVPCNTTPEESAPVVELFNQLGTSLVVDEQHLPAGTTLASCGIAYAMRYIRAAAEGGVELGFKAGDAKDIVMQTVLGAVELLKATGEHPEQAIDRVTTPGGVTIRGLNEMEHAGFTSSVIRGLKAGLGK